MSASQEKLAGRVAIVTGAGGGIGQGIAKLFAQHGAYVVVAEIADTGHETVQEIRESGSQAEWIRTDVSDSRSVQDMIKRSQELGGRLDILVNNAAVQYTQPLWELPEEQFEQMLRTNLLGYYLCAKYAIPHMITQEKGVIIHIASNLALRALKNFSGYSATKGGIVAMSRTMALECAPHGIRVNCICPGSTVTPLMESLLSEMDNADEVVAEAVKLMPAGRLGLPDDVAQLALFLASDEAEMLVGATYVIDGGASIQLPTAEI